MPNDFELASRFIELFGGLEDSKAIGAFGTGEGRWVKRPLRAADVYDHIRGDGPGIGVPPLRPDNTCVFAAIDLDEPDFDAAFDMQEFIPGPSFVERSRSGNAHVWVFFESPIEAWVPKGILEFATRAAGKEHVEVFPKNHDFRRVKLGNYINLPFHGSSRPILGIADPGNERVDMDLMTFLFLIAKNDPEAWRKRAARLQIVEPKPREAAGEFADLHMCAQWIVDGATSGERPITEGHRAAVYFALSKMLRNCEWMDDEESWELVKECNGASPDPFPGAELRRMFDNAGSFRSTGCDDPLVAPFTHPECPIANPRR